MRARTARDAGATVTCDTALDFSVDAMHAAPALPDDSVEVDAAALLREARALIDYTESSEGGCADTGVRSDDRETWLLVRSTGIGASECAAVMGESRWGDAARVYASKLGLAPEIEGEWLEWGLRLEPVVIEAYSSERYSGRYCRRDERLLRSRRWPWLIATLDAWTAISEDADADLCPLEIKTGRASEADDWADGPPRHYEWQLQHQMAVTGSPRASIACLLGGSRLVWCDVERDETMIRALVRATRELWTRVLEERPPESRDPESTALLYPRDDGSSVDLEGRYIELDFERCELSEIVSRSMRRRDQIDAEIQSAMGRARWAELPGGVRYSWRVDSDGKRRFRRHEPREHG